MREMTFRENGSKKDLIVLMKNARKWISAKVHTILEDQVLQIKLFFEMRFLTKIVCMVNM